MQTGGINVLRCDRGIAFGPGPLQPSVTRCRRRSNRSLSAGTASYRRTLSGTLILTLRRGLHSGSQNENGELPDPDRLTQEPRSESDGALCIRRSAKRVCAVFAGAVRFSGSRESDRGPRATLGVAPGPQKNAPKLSSSRRMTRAILMFNDTLWVNNRVRFGPQSDVSNSRPMG